MTNSQQRSVPPNECREKYLTHLMSFSMRPLTCAPPQCVFFIPEPPVAAAAVPLPPSAADSPRDVPTDRAGSPLGSRRATRDSFGGFATSYFFWRCGFPHVCIEGAIILAMIIRMLYFLCPKYQLIRWCSSPNPHQLFCFCHPQGEFIVLADMWWWWVLLRTVWAVQLQSNNWCFVLQRRWEWSGSSLGACQGGSQCKGHPGGFLPSGWFLPHPTFYACASTLINYTYAYT